MNVVILAAGVSKRLSPLTKKRPKGILPLFDRKSLLYRNFLLLSQQSQYAPRLTIVTGHGHEETRQVIDKLQKRFTLTATVVYNANYQTMNNCYSLYLGLMKNQTDDVVVINSDVLYEAALLKNILAHQQTGLVVDNVKPLTDESMKVYVQNGKVTDINKNLLIKKSYGEYIGLAKIHKTHVLPSLKALHRVIKENPSLYYEDAFRLLFHKIPFSSIDTNGLPWIEIDDRYDLQKAKQLYQRMKAKQ